MYCTKISNWGSIPNRKNEVSKLTDALAKTVSSLETMGQLDGIYVSTSLVVPLVVSLSQDRSQSPNRDKGQNKSINNIA